ncbi:hypothetical protein JXJ21_01880 [candidate division KSB1 bacterium]|nr:hypothetical protein [candidate division KSB1 bacterium]
MNVLRFVLISIIGALLISCNSAPELTWSDQWECTVYPPEHKVLQDPETGAKLIFATSDSSRDVNFYFDLNCWFGDQSMLAFNSNRTGKTEIFGYLPATGELVRLQRPDQSGAGNATVDFQTPDIYVARENVAYQWRVDIRLSGDADTRSKVTIKERKIAAAPEGTSFFMGFTESADGKYLSAGLLYANEKRQDIAYIDIETGEIKTLLTREAGISHVQFNKYNPHLLRFSYSPYRMWYIDIRKPGEAIKLHPQEPGELVTHEDWWVNDQMTFCGGYRKEQSHVKIVDIHTQVTRILGGGSWLPDKTPRELAQFNWWHASGSRDGRWVATDNWHGHIAIIDARTSHLRLLTLSHRPYGNVSVEHPHVGWAPDSKSVEFTSHQFGNPDICIAYLPAQWDDPFVKD